MNWNDLKLVIFDADGTLRRRKDGKEMAPLSNDEWELMPGIKEAIDDKLRFRAVFFGIASNQACIFRGDVSEKDAKFMLYELARVLKLNTHENAIKYCKHEPGTCSCRKPEPGMLRDIIRFWRVKPESTLFIGDKEVDEKAAENAGCHFMYIKDFLEKEI